MAIRISKHDNMRHKMRIDLSNLWPHIEHVNYVRDEI